VIPQSAKTWSAQSSLDELMAGPLEKYIDAGVGRRGVGTPCWVPEESIREESIREELVREELIREAGPAISVVTFVVWRLKALSISV
jgi:hypothetical protein